MGLSECVRANLSPRWGLDIWRFYPRLAPWAAFLRRSVAKWQAGELGVGRWEVEQTFGLRRCRAEGSLRDTRSIPQRAQREPIFRSAGASISGVFYLTYADVIYIGVGLGKLIGDPVAGLPISIEG